MSSRSKWAAGPGHPSRTGAKGGYLNRYVIDSASAGQPPAHFERNPPDRGQLAVFPSGGRRTRSARMDQIWALRSRLEKQPTDLRRHHHYIRDGKLLQKVAEFYFPYSGMSNAYTPIESRMFYEVTVSLRLCARSRFVSGVAGDSSGTRERRRTVLGWRRALCWHSFRCPIGQSFSSPVPLRKWGCRDSRSIR
jgi:hypothetical protein